MKNFVLSLCLVLLGIALSSHFTFAQLDNQILKSKIPPGTLRISNEMFADISECSNLDWREYVFWNKTIFGENSSEYSSSLPKTEVWLENDQCLGSYYDNYFFHPAYDGYPVVGVSQDQVRQYSKWRSDRVFEMYLVKIEYINYNPNQNEHDFFTIEKYYQGAIERTDSTFFTPYYPDYQLPNYNEWTLLINVADSLEIEYFNNCKNKKCKKCIEESMADWISSNPCIADSLVGEATRPSQNVCFPYKSKIIHNLNGNVSEWLDDSNTIAGGNWFNGDAETIKLDVDSQESWIGFRNICYWRKWDE